MGANRTSSVNDNFARMGPNANAEVQSYPYRDETSMSAAMRTLSLALLASLSSLSVEVAAKPQEGTSPGVGSEADFTTPLVLSQAEEIDIEREPTPDEEDAWRVYLDLYAFLVPTTYTTTSINGNTSRTSLPLSDVIETLDEALTFKAQVEYGRLGFMAGVYHGSLSDSQSASVYKETSNPLRNRLGLPAGLRERTIRVKGDLDLDVEANQTIVDLAFRYRGGAIQKPRMEKGSSSFVGLMGARVIDANIHTNWTVKSNTTVSVDGRRVSREFTRELERASGESYGNTWVQPLIGVFGTYAISEDWQAFAYLDAGGFGLSGERDLSGTAQAGIAYALGNSAQLSLSYKYFGLDYAGGGGNSYSVDQSGVNLGLRWLFD